MKPRISMITLGVHDLERSISFYEKGLGLPRLESPPSVAFFNLNGTWLGLYGRDELAEDVGVSVEGTGFRSFTLTHDLAASHPALEVVSRDSEDLCPHVEEIHHRQPRSLLGPPSSCRCSARTAFVYAGQEQGDRSDSVIGTALHWLATLTPHNC